MSDRLIVVGGGIVGCSAALFSSRLGWQVTLIERDSIGSRASTAAAGVLSPPFFLDPGQPDHEQNAHPLLSRKGYDFYPDFIEILREYTDVDLGYRVTGTWYLALNEEEHEDNKTIVREMKKFNRPVTQSEPDQLRERLPFISDEVKGGFLFEEEAQVVPQKLMNALDETLRKEGVEVKEHTEVTELSGPGGENSSVGVRVRGELLEAGAVLVAAGCWTPDLLRDQPVKLPVEPRKGQMIKVKAPELLGYPPMRHDQRFILPRGIDVLIGSTVEETGKDTTSTVGAVRDLLNSGKKLVPSLDRGAFKGAWTGLRPYAAKKGGAFLGRVTADSPIFYAAGHYKTGIMQGPFTGRLMARFLSEKETEINVQRYNPDR